MTVKDLPPRVVGVEDRRRARWRPWIEGSRSSFQNWKRIEREEGKGEERSGRRGGELSFGERGEIFSL